MALGLGRMGSDGARSAGKQEHLNMTFRIGANESNRARLKFAVFALACGCGGGEGGAGGRSATGIPGEFTAQCAESGAQCQAGQSAPDLGGSYVGEGSTVLTSNELWTIGAVEPFTANITAQSGQGVVSGVMDIASMTLDIESASIRGEGSAFTIYGTDTEEKDGCSYALKGLISGTKATQGSQITLAGKLVLEFTENIQGQGCDPEKVASYPGTGATFEFSATRNAQ
jgi:hypothetical protein